MNTVKNSQKNLKESGILMKPFLIEAILNTKLNTWPPEAIDPEKPYKGMTRRIIKNVENVLIGRESGPYLYHKKDKTFYAIDTGDADFLCPYGKPGDLLYVKEASRPISWDCQGSWTMEYRDGHTQFIEDGLYEDHLKEMYFQIKLSDMLVEKGCKYDQLEGHFLEVKKHMPWRSPLLMWKKAARIWLQITDIKPERLQDISEKDAILEGIWVWVISFKVMSTTGRPITENRPLNTDSRPSKSKS